MVLHKFGIYNNGVAGGPYTETYVHRYPENSNRPNTTTLSASANLVHNLNPMRGISTRPVTKIESSNPKLRNSAPHLNNNGISGSNRGIELVGMKNNKDCMETDKLLRNEGVLSDNEEFCSLTNDIHASIR